MLRKPLLGFALVSMAAIAVAPAAAQEKVTGEFDLLWNGCWEGPTESVPDWIGTIDVDGSAYDMVFFNVGSGAPPDYPIPEGTGMFNEVWAVYDGLEIIFDEECALQAYEGDLVLWGLDHGAADMEAASYQMTGEVMEAVGPFEGLAGKDVYMSGTFFTNDDGVEQAPGVLEIG
jgi:hypothetical protein